MSSVRKYTMPDAVQIQRQKGFASPPHTHDFIEFVYIIKGSFVHTVDGNEYPLTKGSLVIINYNQTHSFYGDENSEHYNILMKPEFADEQIKSKDDIFALLDVSGFEDFKKLINRGKSVVKFSLEERKHFESIMLLLEKELENKDCGYRATTRSCINLILAMIFRKMSQPDFISDEIVNESLLTYIKEHCNEKLTLGSLSRGKHYNTSYFSRVFKKYTGMPFTEYLKRARIETACELLLNTDSKIDDVCFRVGYSDKTKFFKDFRNFTHTTPLKFRKKSK